MDAYKLVTEGGKKPKKVVHEIRTRKSKNGGYIHEHHHTRPEHHPMEEHTTGDMDGMLAHMKDHMTEPSEGAGSEEQTGAEAQASALGAE